jgi:hypothetical protein
MFPSKGRSYPTTSHRMKRASSRNWTISLEHHRSPTLLIRNKKTPFDTVDRFKLSSSPVYPRSMPSCDSSISPRRSPSLLWDQVVPERKEGHLLFDTTTEEPSTSTQCAIGQSSLESPTNISPTSPNHFCSRLARRRVFALHPLALSLGQINLDQGPSQAASQSRYCQSSERW